jgi:hypothetical protein
MVLLTVNEFCNAAILHATTLHPSLVACAKLAVMGAIRRRRA